MTQRINYIDRMKGFAILVVVLAHVFLFSFDMGDNLILNFVHLLKCHYLCLFQALSHLFLEISGGFKEAKA